MSIETSLSLLRLSSLDDLTAESLKRAFKTAMVFSHPDKGGEEGDFDKMVSAYLHLSTVLKRLSGGRDGLQSVLAVDEVQKAREDQFVLELNNMINSVFDNLNQQENDVFNKEFNEQFEKLHIRESAKGYESWLRTHDDYKKDESSPPVSMEEWNQQFIKNICNRSSTANTSIILHPDDMAYHLGPTMGTSLICKEEDTFTSHGWDRPEYTDLRAAYTSEHTILDKLPNYMPTHQTFDELMAERDKVYDIHQDNELEAIAAYEKKKQEEEKEHTRRITEYFKGTGSSSWALRNKNSDPMEETSSDSFIKQF